MSGRGSLEDACRRRTAAHCRCGRSLTRPLTISTLNADVYNAACRSDRRSAADLPMRAQIFLIALLVWGPIGSVICEASCLQSSLAGHEAAVALPAAPVAGAHPCHGSGDPIPASGPTDSGSSHSTCGCAGSDRALTAALPSIAQGSILLASAPPVEVPASQTAASVTFFGDPPGRPSSPYRHQNPPLLI